VVIAGLIVLAAFSFGCLEKEGDDSVIEISEVQPQTEVTEKSLEIGRVEK